jgi:hypothetical protein
MTEDQDIRDLIEDLDTIGHSRKLRISVSVGINTNEFLVTNVSKFLESKIKEMESEGVEFHFISSISNTYSPSNSSNNKYAFTITGLHWKVRKVYENLLHWPWIDPSKTMIEYEEEIE